MRTFSGGAEASSSTHQAPEKLQIPSSNRAALPRSGARLGQPQAGPIPQYFKAAVEVWSLVFPWLFEAWSLGGDAFFGKSRWVGVQRNNCGTHSAPRER